MTVTNKRLLYLLYILHQTTTNYDMTPYEVCCISCISYIKPQLSTVTTFKILVVSLVYPTSNHNSQGCCPVCSLVVSLVYPTSNHNFADTACITTTLYLLYILHQTTTPLMRYYTKSTLYLLYILHQTTTNAVSDQKPDSLYLLYILHQTTTAELRLTNAPSCISCISYIKPQPGLNVTAAKVCCISCISYIKPQLAKSLD